MTNINLGKYFNLILVCLPAFMLLGQFITNSLAIIYSIYVIISLVLLDKERLSIIFRIKCVLLLFLFAIILTISTILNFDKNFDISVIANVSIFLAIFFIIGVYQNLNNYKHFILKKLYIVCLVSFIFIFLIVCFDIFFYFDYFVSDTSIKVLHRYLFENEIMGTYAMRFYPLLVALSLIFKKYNNLIFIFLFISSLILVVLSFQRIMIIDFFLINTLFFFFFRSLRNFLVSMFAILITTFLSLELYNFANNKNLFSEKFTSEIIQDNKIYIYTPHYQGHYITASKMINENLFFGIGPNQFRNKCSNDKYKYIFSSWIDSGGNGYKEANSCSSHPHHYFLQIFAEGGAFAFIILTFLYSSLIYLLFKFKHKIMSESKILFYGSSISVITIYFPLTPSHNFYNGWTNIPLFLTLGILIYAYFSLVKEKN